MSRRSIASATKGPPSTGWSSGAARSSPTPSAVIAARPRTTRKRSWSSSATRAASRKSAATGPSCATAASTPTPASSSSWLDRMTHAPRFRMPAEWEPHEATWIAWPHNARTGRASSRPIPWVYAEIVRHLAACERVRILVNDAEPRAGPPHSAKVRRRPGRGRFLPVPDRPRLDARLRPDLRQATGGRRSRSPTGASTAGRSTTN